jgi:hypothetical protein
LNRVSLRSNAMTPGSLSNMRRMVLSLSPHHAASSLTEKCFSKAGALEGGILKEDSSCTWYRLLLSDISVTMAICNAGWNFGQISGYLGKVPEPGT